MSFLDRLFQIFKREDGVRQAAELPVQTARLASRPPPREVIVRWREIIDGACGIAGYFLCPAALAGASRISGAALIAALEDEGVGRLVEARMALVPVTAAQWEEADFGRLAKPNTFFLLAAKDAAGANIADFRQLAAACRGAGAKVAADADGDGLASDDDEAAFVDMLLLHLEGASLADLERRIRRAREQNPALLLAVDGVTSWHEYRLLQSLGVAFCIGSFIATLNDEHCVEKISQSRLVIIEMLNMLRKEADVADLAVQAKRDPVVVLKLLEMANSPLSGLSRRVTTLDEAIAVLGYNALYRWLALAMFQLDKSGKRDESLMLVALGRAAFLEALCPESEATKGGELFLVGLFSLIDSLLQMPVEKVIASMYLSEAVSSVLLRREGPYACYLQLAVAMEHGRVTQALTLCATMGISTEKLLKCYRESRTWAASDARVEGRPEPASA